MNELVYLKHDEVVCDSLQVAEKFGKRHDNVVRDIVNLLKNEEIKNKKIFHQSTYKDSKGRTYKSYTMNRKGFIVLVMGFNGEEAIHWKLMYIDAFDKMESIIREKSTQIWLETRKDRKLTRQRAGMTQKEVAEYLGVTIRSYQRIESGDRTGEIQTWDLLEDLMNVMQ